MRGVWKEGLVHVLRIQNENQHQARLLKARKAPTISRRRRRQVSVHQFMERGFDNTTTTGESWTTEDSEEEEDDVVVTTYSRPIQVVLHEEIGTDDLDAGFEEGCVSPLSYCSTWLFPAISLEWRPNEKTSSKKPFDCTSAPTRRLNKSSMQF
jgi:hypothetical protein